MCCKRLADEEPSNWKIILSYHLKLVGNNFILCCNFDIKKMLVNLSRYYNEYLECFT